MKIIYIGTMVPECLIQNYPETSVAANNFQLGLLAGLLNIDSINCQLYSVPARRSWPGKGSVLRQSKEVLSWHSSNKIQIVPFINIKFWKELSIRIHTFFALKSALWTDRNNDKTVVISYNGDGRLSAAIRILKKHYDFTYVCMVVDPPEYKGTTNRQGIIWNYLYKQNHISYMKAVRCAESLVVLNEDFLKINRINKPYILIDGGVSMDVIKNIQLMQPLVTFNENKFNIVFTGTLHEHSGIIRLIEMFESYKDERLCLHIYGDGVLHEKVEELVKSDSRVIYYGNVDYQTAISAQHEADLIVCPNPIDHPINRVAFPSKLIEYLVSGTLILSTKLDSIDDDYENCMIFYDDTKEDFENKLTEILSMPEENKVNIIQKAYTLAFEKKAWNKQTQRLLNFIREQK